MEFQSTLPLDGVRRHRNAPNGPDEIYGILHGTSCQDPVVKWWLSADATCNWGSPDSLVGSRTPHLCSNTPLLLHPNPYDFRGVPPGDYHLCAFIDPADVISETNAGTPTTTCGPRSR